MRLYSDTARVATFSSKRLKMTNPLPPIYRSKKTKDSMSIDGALSKANNASFSVIGVVCSLLGCVYIFSSSIEKDAFKYGYGSLINGAQLIALGTLLQHTKNLASK